MFYISALCMGGNISLPADIMFVQWKSNKEVELVGEGFMGALCGDSVY